MNISFKSIWNKNTGAWVAVSEITKTHQGAASSTALLPQSTALPALSRIAQQLKRCFTTPLSVFLSLSLLAPMAQAANVNWTGATSNDWYVGTNWDGGAVPTETGSDSVVINQGTVSFINNLTNVGQMTLNSLAIANAVNATGSLIIQDLGDANQWDGFFGTFNQLSIGTAAGAVGSLTLQLDREENANTSLNIGPGNALLAVGANGGKGSLIVNLADYGTDGGTRSAVRSNVGLQLGAGAGSVGEFTLTATGGAPFRADVYDSQFFQSFGGSVGSGGGTGVVTLDNTTWDVDGSDGSGTQPLHGLLVGDGAGSTGTVNVNNGSWLHAFDQPSQGLLGASVRIGNNGGTGGVNVGGPNSLGTPSALSSGKGLSIGHGGGGAGNLNILSGGKGVSALGSYSSMGLGSASVQAGIDGGTGNIVVSGMDASGKRSALQVLGWAPLGQEGGTGDLFLGVGSGSKGQLTIADAGQVEIGTATLQYLYDPDNYTSLGYAFLGALAGNACGWDPANPTPCGKSNGLLYLAPDAGATGTLNIGAAAGQSAVAPGTLSAGAVVFGQGTSSMVFNHTDISGSYAFTTPLSSATVGAGVIDVRAGTTWLNSDNKTGFTLTRDELDLDSGEETKDVLIGGFSGQTNLYGGALGLDNNYALGTSEIHALDNSTLIYGKTVGVTIDNTLAVDAGKTLSAQVDGGLTSTQSGQLSGGGTLQKTGNGTLVFSNTNSTIGNVNVAAGTLQFTQYDSFHLTTPFKVTGNYTTQNGATTRLDNTASTLSIGGVFTQASGSTLIINTNVLSPDIVAASAVLQGALNLSGFSYSDPSNIVKASELTETTIIHTTGSASNGITGSFDGTTGTSTTLGPDYLVGNGHLANNNNDYVVGFTLAWISGGQTDGTGDFTLGSGSAFNVDEVLADQTGTFDLGWDGKSLTKDGAGLLILSQANTYTGSTTLNGGTLVLAENLDPDNSSVLLSDGSIESSSAVTLNAGTFDISGINATGTSVKELSGAVDSQIVLGAKTLTINNTADHLVGSLISGNGALDINAAGKTLILTGENTYRGKTTLSTGTTLQIGDGAANGGGSLQSSEIYATSGSNVVFNRDAASSYDGKFSGNESDGYASLSKTGAGVLFLSGLASTVGSVTVENGTLAFEQDNGSSTAPAEFAVTGDYTTKDGATTELGKTGSTLNIGGKFTQEANSILNITTGMGRPDIIADTADLDGTLSLAGFRFDDPTLIVSASDLAVLGTTIIQTSNGISCGGVAATGGEKCFDVVTGSGTTVTGGPDYLVGTGEVRNNAANGANAQDYVLGFELSWNSGSTGTGNFTVAAGSTFNVDAILSSKTAVVGWDGNSLTKEGLGTLVLSKENAYTGSTTLSGGTLKLMETGSIASSQAVTLKNTGSTLDLSATDLGATTLQNLTSGDAGTQVLLGANALTVKSNANELSIDGNTTFAGDLIGTAAAGATQIIKEGSGTLTLSGKTDYLGDTEIKAGMLVLEGNSAGSTARLTSNVVGQPGTDFNLNNNAKLTGTITGSNVLIDNRSLWAMTASSNVGDVNLAGTIGFASPGATLTQARTLTAKSWFGGWVNPLNLLDPDDDITLPGVVTLYAKLGNSNSISDQIVIDGGAATGYTQLRIINAGGLGDQTSGNGINIVHTINGATTTTDAFSLAASVGVGAYTYKLYRGGLTLMADDDWYLRSIFSGGGSGGDPRPDYRPETSLFSATANQALRYDAVSVGTLHERMGNVDELNQQSGRLAWGRVIAQHDKNDGARDGIYDGSIAAKGDISAFQVGSDFYVNSEGAGRTSVGGFITAGQSDYDVTHVDVTGARVAAGSNKLTAFSVGGYLTHLDGSGAYLDSVVQATSFRVNNEPKSSASSSTHALGLTASLEIGKRFAIGDAQQGYSITPQAQIVLQSLKINESDVASDIDSSRSAVRFDRSHSAQLRVGARLARTWTASGSSSSTSLWLTPSLTHTSGSATQTRFATPTQGDVVFQDDLPGTRIGLQAGMEGALSKTVSINARLGAERNVGGDKQTSAFGQVGVKIAF